jgi:hypothetical protein
VVATSKNKQNEQAEADTVDDDLNLFREAVKDARPLTAEPIYSYNVKPKPIPKQFMRDERQALADSLSDFYIPAHELSP